MSQNLIKPVENGELGESRYTRAPPPRCLLSPESVKLRNGAPPPYLRGATNAKYSSYRGVAKKPVVCAVTVARLHPRQGHRQIFVARLQGPRRLGGEFLDELGG